MNAENTTLTRQYPGIVILSTAPPDTILLAAAPTDAYSTQCEKCLLSLMSYPM